MNYFAKYTLEKSIITLNKVIVSLLDKVQPHLRSVYFNEFRREQDEEHQKLLMYYIEADRKRKEEYEFEDIETQLCEKYKEEVNFIDAIPDAKYEDKIKNLLRFYNRIYDEHNVDRFEDMLFNDESIPDYIWSPNSREAHFFARIALKLYLSLIMFELHNNYKNFIDKFPQAYLRLEPEEFMSEVISALKKIYFDTNDEKELSDKLQAIKIKFDLLRFDMTGDRVSHQPIYVYPIPKIDRISFFGPLFQIKRKELPINEIKNIYKYITKQYYMIQTIAYGEVDKTNPNLKSNLKLKVLTSLSKFEKESLLITPKADWEPLIDILFSQKSEKIILPIGDKLKWNENLITKNKIFKGKLRRRLVNEISTWKTDFTLGTCPIINDTLYKAFDLKEIMTEKYIYNILDDNYFHKNIL